jgi:hypothetical protein
MPEVPSREGRRRPARVLSVLSRGLLVLGIAAALGLGVPAARADEGGVSFWLPGQFGSASQFLSEHWPIGLVGYVYPQVTGDSSRATMSSRPRTGRPAGTCG